MSVSIAGWPSRTIWRYGLPLLAAGLGAGAALTTVSLVAPTTAPVQLIYSLCRGSNPLSPARIKLAERRRWRIQQSVREQERASSLAP